MNFLKTIGSSIHSPKFYAGLNKKTLKQSFGYFFLLILLLTIINSIALIKPLLIDAPIAVSNFVTDTINCYPEDLIFSVKNGVATSSAKEPFVVSCNGQNMATIDTKTPYSSSKFDEYKSEMWITKDAVVYKKNDYETRQYSLSKVNDFSLNKEILVSQQKKYAPYLKFLGPIIMTIISIGIFLAYIFKLIHLLILALIVIFMGKMYAKEISFKNAYITSTYAITLGLLVEIAINLTSTWTKFHGFPFMVTVLTVAVVFVNLFMEKKTNSLQQ